MTLDPRDQTVHPVFKQYVNVSRSPLAVCDITSAGRPPPPPPPPVAGLALSLFLLSAKKKNARGLRFCCLLLWIYASNTGIFAEMDGRAAASDRFRSRTMSVRLQLIFLNFISFCFTVFCLIVSFCIVFSFISL